MEQFTDEKSVPSIDSLQQLIEHLKQVFDSDRVNVDYVKAVLASYKSNKNDWTKYAIFDKYRYTRNLVDIGNGKYNLIALCWGEGQSSSVHDHSDAHCFVKMLEGQLKETLFEWPTVTDDGEDFKGNGCSLIEKDVKFCNKNDVTYINDSIGLHRVENPSHSEPAVSLHLYSPPFNFCRTFDQRTGATQQVQMTFWSKFGQLVTTNGSDSIDQSPQITGLTPASAPTSVITPVNNTEPDIPPSRHRRHRRRCEKVAAADETAVVAKRKRCHAGH